MRGDQELCGRLQFLMLWENPVPPQASVSTSVEVLTPAWVASRVKMSKLTPSLAVGWAKDHGGEERMRQLG